MSLSQDATAATAEIQRCIHDHQKVVADLLLQLPPRLQAAAEISIQCLRQGGKLIFFGNGGSAADAQHLAAEFVGRFQADRRPLPALALHADTSILTSIANDFGYEQVFVRPLTAWAQAGDVAVGISTSGNSPNVLAALRKAKEMACPTIALTGQQDCQARSLADIHLPVPSLDTARIQECHILMGHILCAMIDAAMSGTLARHFEPTGL